LTAGFFEQLSPECCGAEAGVAVIKLPPGVGNVITKLRLRIIFYFIKDLKIFFTEKVMVASIHVLVTVTK
jgi:hypothetical protein